MDLDKPHVSQLELGDRWGAGVMIACSWRRQTSALAMFVLIVSTSHLGAQRETPQAGSLPNASSNQHSESRGPRMFENEEIKWEDLREHLIAKLKAGVAEPEDESEITYEIRYEDDGPWMAVLYLECVGKTDEKHGLLRLRWDKRRTWTIGLLKLGAEKYRIVKAEESVELRAPAGDWRVQHEHSRDVQANSIGQVFIGTPH